MPRATLRQRAHGVRRALCICVRVRTQPRTMPSTRILSPFHVHSLSPPSFVRHPFDYSVTRIAHAIFNEGALDTRRRSRQFIPAILAVLAPALASFSQLSHRSPSREPFGMQIARNAACASSISGRRNPVCSQADPTERSPRWLGIPRPLAQRKTRLLDPRYRSVPMSPGRWRPARILPLHRLAWTHLPHSQARPRR